MPFSIATWNINSVRLRLPIVERLLTNMRPTYSACRKPSARTNCSRSRRSEELGYGTSRSTARRAITASPRFRAGRWRSSSGGVSARWRIAGISRPGSGRRQDRSCCTISMCRPAATSPIRRSTGNSATSSISSQEMNGVPRRIERRIGLGPGRRPEHRAARKRRLVAQAAAEGRQPYAGRDQSFEAMRKAGGWVDLMRHVVPPDQKLYTWWSYRAADWELSDRGRRLDQSGRPQYCRRPSRHRRAARRARLGPPVGPRAGDSKFDWE